MNAQQLTFFSPMKFTDIQQENWTSDCWRSPNTQSQPIVDLVVQCLGSIGLDPTADKGRTIPASKHFTRSDNCFIQDWVCESGTVFMNPPYSNPHSFIVKLAEQFITFKNVKEAIVLVPSRCLHNKNSGEVIEEIASAFCHWRSPRIAFLDQNGKPATNANFDCSFIYLGDRVSKFADVFQKWGTISIPFRAVDASFALVTDKIKE